MGRVINPESAGRERTRLLQAVALAVRALMSQTVVDQNTRDVAAFIGLALGAITETIDASVVAWEKRGYWVKADRFRMEWAWAQRLGEAMCQAVRAEDWAQVAEIVAQVSEKLQGVKLPQRRRLGSPWVGAWKSLMGK